MRAALEALAEVCCLAGRVVASCALKSGPVRSFYHFWKRLRLRLVYILSLGPKDWTGPLWTSPYQSESSPKTGLTWSTCRPVSNQLKPVFGQFSTGLLL
jgi:hypothetical protein